MNYYGTLFIIFLYANNFLHAFIPSLCLEFYCLYFSIQFQFLLSKEESEHNLPGMENRTPSDYLTKIFQLPDSHLFFHRILCTLAVVTVTHSLVTADVQFVV
jgi:hypothetical protein